MSVAPIPALSITSLTVEEMLAELIQRIPTITDRWTDFNASDIGIALLTLFCGVGELTNYETDSRASELTISHVRQRANAIRLLKLIGYSFSTRSSSVTTFKFSVASAQPLSIPIVPYFDANPTKIKTRNNNPIYFSTDKRTYLPAGSLEVSVQGVQGKRGNDTFTGLSGVEDQLFTLTSTTAAEGTIKVKVNGIIWKEVDAFFESNSTSKHYQVLVDIDGRIYVQFGDGVLGKIPVGAIDISYIISDGPNGNVYGKNRITEIEGSMYFVDATTVTSGVVSVTNTEDASGGAEEESVFHAKKVAPRVYAAQKRAVIKDDFSAWSEKFPGVRQAKTFDIDDVDPESFLIDYFQVKVCVVPIAGTYPTASLKRRLQAYLELLKDVPDNIEVIDPQYVPVNVSVDIYIKKPPVDPTVVKANVITAIQEFFTPAETPAGELLIGDEVEGQIFGEDVSVAALLAKIQAVDGVASITNFSPSSNVTIDIFEMARLAATPTVNVIGVI